MFIAPGEELKAVGEAFQTGAGVCCPQAWMEAASSQGAWKAGAGREGSEKSQGALMGGTAAKVEINAPEGHSSRQRGGGDDLMGDRAKADLADDIASGLERLVHRGVCVAL